MFFVATKPGDNLDEGIQVTVNGEAVRLWREGNCLVYQGQAAEPRRAPILETHEDGDLICWTCASPGQNPAECEILTPAIDDPELTSDQLNQQEYVEDAISGLLCELLGTEVGRDLDFIRDVRDAIVDALERRGKSSMEFYPYIEG